VGSSFDDFLAEEEMLPAVEARAIKRVVAWELREALKRHGLTKAVLARRMHTSRAALDRLLDPGNVSLTLGVLTRAAHVLGKRVQVAFVKAPRRRGRAAERGFSAPARRRPSRR
jgi:transcriptional regulator with XRE-family HTH domain